MGSVRERRRRRHHRHGRHHCHHHRGQRHRHHHRHHRTPVCVCASVFVEGVPQGSFQPSPDTKLLKQILSYKSMFWEFVQYILYTLIYLYILIYTFIYLHIPPNTFICLNIPPYTSKYRILVKLGPTQKHKNHHNSGPRASPKVQIQPK